ncbi:hypothetical protein CL628_01195 [bacterium]|nr:hypothetical protein [bacterium]
MVVETRSEIKPAQRPTKTRPDTKVGLLLASARRRGNLSLEDASRDIKIPVRHLQGIEEGNLAVFPAEVYARGAFTKYASYLGVLNRANQRAFQRVLTGAREYVPLRMHTPQSWWVAFFTPRWIIAGAIALAAAAVGSYVLWQVSAFVALPELQLAQPVAGVITNSQVTVSGRADTAAVVEVNGQQAVVDASGRFSTELGLHTGINVIQVTATNAAGRVRTIQKDILVPPL